MIQLGRLVAMVLVFAWLGYVVCGTVFEARDAFYVTRQWQLNGAVLGAFVGVTVELWLRGVLLSEPRRFTSFSLREMLIVTALVALAIGVVVLTRH